jgi:TonB family protein
MRVAFLVAIASLVSAAPAASQQGNTVRDGLAAIAARNSASPRPAPPMPASDPGTWVRTEDYPPWAAARGVTGSVAVVVDVDTSGRVTGCEVRESSEVPDFDRIACEKITERARFLPARDEQGNPVAARWQNRVVWALPQRGPELVPEPAELAVSMVVEADGSVSKCVVERAEGAAARAAKSIMCDSAGPFQPPLDKQGNPHRRRIRLVTSVENQPLP